MQIFLLTLSQSIFVGKNDVISFLDEMTLDDKPVNSHNVLKREVPRSLLIYTEKGLLNNMLKTVP